MGNAYENSEPFPIEERDRDNTTKAKMSGVRKSPEFYAIAISSLYHAKNFSQAKWTFVVFLTDFFDFLYKKNNLIVLNFFSLLLKPLNVLDLTT